MVGMASARRRLQGALAALLLAALLCAQSVAAQATVSYSKFLLFFQLLDQSGSIAKEFAGADGDLCKVKGIVCEAGQVVVMCAPFQTMPNVDSIALMLFPSRAIMRMSFLTHLACALHMWFTKRMAGSVQSGTAELLVCTGQVLYIVRVGVESAIAGVT